MFGFIARIGGKNIGLTFAGLVLLGYWAVNRRATDDGVREDQPVAADLAAPEPGAGVPVQRARRSDTESADPVADGRPIA